MLIDQLILILNKSINKFKRESLLKIKMLEQNTPIPTIPDLHLKEIFLDNTLFVFTTALSQTMTKNQGIKSSLLISNNEFIIPQMKYVQFISIDLIINSKSDVIINNKNNINQIVFDDVNIYFECNKTLQFQNMDSLIIQKMTIKDQVLKQRDQPSISFQNISIIHINQLVIQNITSEEFSLMVFNEVKQLTIDSLLIEQKSIFSSPLLEFKNSINMLIKNATIQNIVIRQQSLLRFINTKSISFIFLNCTSVDDNLQTDKRQLQENNDQIKHIIQISGSKQTEFQKIQFQNNQNVGLIKAQNLLDRDILIYNFYLNITNSMIKNINNKNSNFYILDLEGFNLNLTNFNISSTNSSQGLVNIASNKALIEDSQYEDIKLEFGSVFSIKSHVIDFNKCNFNRCNSIKSSGGIECKDSVKLQIHLCQFQQIQNINSTKNGGAITISNIDQVLLLNNTFSGCISKYFGGSIYASNFGNKTINLTQNIFNQNSAEENSGGAMYMEDALNIEINLSEFNNNQAKKERGGAIALYMSQIVSLNQTYFVSNQAHIGGAIWYNQDSQAFTLKGQLKAFIDNCQNNEGYYYGNNIGSLPKKIARVTDQNQIDFSKEIKDLQSGSIVNSNVYFNFLDEENQPFKNFKTRNDIEYSKQILSESLNYYLYLDNSNINIIVKKDEYLIQVENNKTEHFQFKSAYLQLTSIILYRNQQNQKVFIKSDVLKVPFELDISFRNCIRGEIFQVDFQKFIECKPCGNNEYSIDIPNMNINQSQSLCKKCPESAKNCNTSLIVLNDGYWKVQDTDEIYKCNLNGCSETNEETKFNCIEGYVGPLCDSCDSSGKIWGRSFGRSENSCLPCSQNKSSYVYMIFFSLFYVFYLANSLLKQMEQKIILLKLDLLRKIDLLITSKSCSQSNDLFSWIKMFIHYSQLLSLFFVFSSTKFPYSLEICVNIFGDPTTLTVTNFDCVTSTSPQYPLWFHRIIYTFGKFMIQLIFIALLMFLSIRIKHKNKQIGKEKVKYIFAMSYVYSYLFFQPSISKLLLSALFCRNIGDKKYLKSDLQFECYSDMHNIYIISVIAPLIFIWCIFIPFIIYRKLKYFQHSSSQRNNIRQILVYGILYKNYKNEFLYWEIIKILKKLMLMILINLEFKDTIKIATILAILLLYFISLIQFQPYKNSTQFKFEKILIIILLFTYIFLFYIIQSDITTDYFAITGYIIIISLNIYLFKFLAQEALGSIVIMIESNQNGFKKILYQLKQKYPKLLFMLRFTRVKTIRIHKLWQKVIFSLRQKELKIEYKLTYNSSQQPTQYLHKTWQKQLFEKQQSQQHEINLDSDVFQNQNSPKQSDHLLEYVNIILFKYLFSRYLFQFKKENQVSLPRFPQIQQQNFKLSLEKNKKI